MRKKTIKKAIILAGGKGTRLHPVTYEIPKPLLPVKRKPIINYLVDLFLSQGIRDIAILINKDFRDDFKWWRKRYYSSVSSGQALSAGSRQVLSAGSPQAPSIIFSEEEEPLGTFGGIWHLKKWVGKNNFFLTNGDELKKIDLRKMADFHNKKQALGTIALVKVPNPQDYGVVICEKGIIKEFLEKPSLAQISKKCGADKNPSSNYINSGLYLFSPNVLKNHPGPKFTMVETDVFPKLAREEKLAGFKFSGPWMDTGTFERYSGAIKNWKKA